MARSAVLAILAANFVAVGVLYSYFSNTEAGVQFNLKAHIHAFAQRAPELWSAEVGGLHHHK